MRCHSSVTRGLPEPGVQLADRTPRRGTAAGFPFSQAGVTAWEMAFARKLLHERRWEVRSVPQKPQAALPPQPRAARHAPAMLRPTQKAYMRKEESSPTVMWALPISRPPLYSTDSRIRFPESPVCGTETRSQG